MSFLKTKVAAAVLVVLLVIPVSIAQSTKILVQPLCTDQELSGVVVRVREPGVYRLSFNNGLCTGRTEAQIVRQGDAS